MKQAIQIIPLDHLAITFVPVIVTIVILYRWSLEAGTGLYAMVRMLLQLLLIGYALASLFDTERGEIIVAVLAMMLFISSWIALRTIQLERKALYLKALSSIILGGVSTLLLVVYGVLEVSPWYAPSIIIPLAGMIFANAMTSVSLAAERFAAEHARGVEYHEARRIALRASLIPITNSLFAVGLVSLPGMMTGQILSGVSPLIAARYQIMVMCMIYGSSGITAACFLWLIRPTEETND